MGIHMGGHAMRSRRQRISGQRRQLDDLMDRPRGELADDTDHLRRCLIPRGTVGGTTDTRSWTPAPTAGRRSRRGSHAKAGPSQQVIRSASSRATRHAEQPDLGVWMVIAEVPSPAQIGRVSPLRPARLFGARGW